MQGSGKRMRRKVQMGRVVVQWNFWCGVEIVRVRIERERQRRMGSIVFLIGRAFSASMLSKRYTGHSDRKGTTS